MLYFFQSFIQIFSYLINVAVLQATVGAPFVHLNHQANPLIHRNRQRLRSSHLAESGRADYRPITDKEAMDAFALLSRTEGIIPAIESAHAIAGAREVIEIDRADGEIFAQVVYGDGSFGLNGFEYDTAVRFNLPIGLPRAQGGELTAARIRPRSGAVRFSRGCAGPAPASR